MEPKNLVLFSDGTGNSAGKLFKTNVWRVYQALDLTDPLPLTIPRQFAYYDDGVGTSTFKPLAIAGGAFGVGLARNVVDLYVFLCRTYQPGDRIYAFGFSRGAFTIRVLIGLVMTQGLLRYSGSEQDLQRWAWDAYRAYRREKFPGNCFVQLMRWLRDRLLNAKNRLLGNTCFEDAKRIGQPDTADAIHIEFLGLWDTVDAYGLPVDQLTRAIDRFIWPLTMRNYVLNDRVKCARHALSLDDERRSFYPRLWTEDKEPADSATHIRDKRICQVWFAGVHSNLGGGYPDDSLSLVPLQWIMDEANRCNLRFKNTIWDEFRALSDENGPVYDSRKGIACYYAYNPRRMEWVNHGDHVNIVRGKVHESVLRRIRVDPDGYAPIVLAEDFDVVCINGQIVPVNNYLDTLAHPSAGSPAPATPWFASYTVARERVFNSVWWRRIAYYLTLFVSLTLFTMPAWAPGEGVCRSNFCFLTSPLKLLDTFIPSFATAWTNSFTSSPHAFLPLLVLLGLCFGLSKRLDVQISDRMRQIWYAIAPLKPAAVYQMKPPPALNKGSESIKRLRSADFGRIVVRCLTRRVLPFVFVLAIFAYAAITLTQVVFAGRSSTGLVCSSSSVAGTWFSPRELCHDTQTQVIAGNLYQITLEIPIGNRWHDDTIPAGPGGFTCALPWYKALGFAALVPARRHLTQAWFQPMAKIGDNGNDVFAIDGHGVEPSELSSCPSQSPPVALPCPPDVASLGQMEKTQMRFLARSSGPLYLYVNDVVGVPFSEDFFYSNNRGCAKVTVTQVNTSGR
jgi:uncharacterized protein (DUF2235 family)